MKTLILLAFLIGCTQKYADYDLIRKADYDRQNYERPITRLQVLTTGKDSLSSCFNQWLFFSNAEKEKEDSIPMLVKSLCPREGYLLNARMTESWWTTIIYSRACVDIETSCAKEKRK